MQKRLMYCPDCLTFVEPESAMITDKPEEGPYMQYSCKGCETVLLEEKLTGTARKLLASRENDRECDIVLYELTDNEATPYVTWMVRKDNPLATFMGHYHHNIVDAVHDYEKRNKS